MILPKSADPMGRAIYDYTHTGCAKKLRVLSTMFDEDEIPVAELFSTAEEMPLIERAALSLCRGRILDVGAGAGRHSLQLQSRGMNVTAIDISPFSVEAMQTRGVEHALCADFFTDDFGTGFDTILMLMNGTGIAGHLSDLPHLFDRCRALLSPGGQVLVDSTDLRYIYEDEDGNFDPTEFESYYGEVDYQMAYGDCKGQKFDWLYVDFATLAQAAEENGLKATKVADGEHYNYLAALSVAQQV